MEKIIIEIRSVLNVNIEITDFPELTTRFRLLNRGIALVKSKFPAVIRNLSREDTLSRLKEYKIDLRCRECFEEKTVRRALKIWLGRKRIARLMMVLGGIAVLPFAVLLSIIPGPNVVVYLVLLGLYFFTKSYIALVRTRFEDLQIDIVI